MSELWVFAVVLGPVVLAILFAYSLLSKRRLTASETSARRDATERLYREPPRS